MTVECGIQLVRNEAQTLALPLFEGMAYAIARAEQRSVGLPHFEFPHLRPLTVRCDLRKHLQLGGLPPTWRLGGNPALMGQLRFEAPNLGLTFRFLKERRRGYPGGTPVAGHNQARRQSWQQPSLVSLPGQATTPTEFLVLWDFQTGMEDGFTLRVVHTVEPGVFGRAVRLDMDWAIQPGGVIFEELTFVSGEDVDFFETEIDQEENQAP